MNARNVVKLTGMIPETDKIKYEFVEGDDDKSDRMWGSISVRAAYKKPEDQYYPNDLIPFTAWGTTAKFMHEYIQRGDTIEMLGELKISPNREKDGQIIYGTPYVKVDAISKVGGTRNVDTDEVPSNEANSSTRKNPFASKRRSVI